MYAQLAEEVVDTVDEQVEGCAARCEEAAPPPVVILKVKVLSLMCTHYSFEYFSYLIPTLNCKGDTTTKVCFHSMEENLGWTLCHN